MASAQVDKRASSALNIFYGARSFNATMAGKWVHAGVTDAYLYGGALDVLYSAVGYASISQMSEMGEFPYSLEVATNALSSFATPISNWREVTQRWLEIHVSDVEHSLGSPGDLLILVEPTIGSFANRAQELLRQAMAVGCEVLIILKKGEKLPALASQIKRLSVSENEVLNPLMVPVVDASVAMRHPDRIFLAGGSLRVVAAAMGAVDHFNRHQGGKELYAQNVSRVMVDDRCPILSQRVSNLLEVLDQLQIAHCDAQPNGVVLGNERDATRVHPARL